MSSQSRSLHSNNTAKSAAPSSSSRSSKPSPFLPVARTKNGDFVPAENAGKPPPDRASSGSFLCCGAGGRRKGKAIGHVGLGGGDYILETRYKYIGNGAGDHRLVDLDAEEDPCFQGGRDATRGKGCCPCCCVLLLLVAAAAALGYLFVPQAREFVDLYLPGFTKDAEDVEASILKDAEDVQASISKALPIGAPGSSDDSSAAEEQSAASNDADASQAATEVQTKNALIRMKVLNIDYDTVHADDNLRDHFATMVKQAVSYTAGKGVLPEGIEVDIKPGSVIVLATVKPPDMVNIDFWKQELTDKRDVIQDAVGISLNMIKNLEDVLTGGSSLVVEDVTVSLVEAKGRGQEGALPAAPPVANTA